MHDDMGRFGLVIPPPLLCFTSRSIDFSSAEETAHILRVLLAILGGNDDLIFRRRLAFGSVWVSLKKTSTLVEPLLTSATGVIFGLLTDFLVDLLFLLCALEDRLGAAWSSTGRRSVTVLIGTSQVGSNLLARCKACSAMHRTCNHLRQPALEHCTISSSGFCGASSTHIFRNSCKSLVSKMCSSLKRA